MSPSSAGAGSPGRPPSAASFQAALCLGALGVVFGDIGTSPLYTMKECRDHLPPGLAPEAGILGVLSLMIWSLVLVVGVKYLLLVTRADNEGEGGIFALLARLHRREPAARASRIGFSTLLILVGAALLYGDGVITPAISVLGAAEGLPAVNASLAPAVPWMAAAILVLLFWFQSHGTDRIGRVFGPVMLAWFAVLGGLGAWHVARQPAVLAAFDPRHGLRLLQQGPAELAALLGAVVLTITGAEALYADMGHFGRRAIARAWYGVAFPGLLLNYLGQGAYLLGHPGSGENPFFALAPAGGPRAALTVLAFAAAVIASQALISGAFSLTRQAIQLGYFPRLEVRHTNAAQMGQIYLPFVNLLLALGCVATTLAFRTTTHLAAAYGIAVTGTMAVTTYAFCLVARREWRWSWWILLPAGAALLALDLGFLGANAVKVREGGWFPLAIGAALLLVMHTWKTGRAHIYRVVYGQSVTEPELASIARSHRVRRVPGAAVFMVGAPRGAPAALLHHLRANRALHEVVVLLTMATEDVPAVPEDGRLEVTAIGAGIWRVVGRYGYMESPDATALLARLPERGVAIDPAAATYFFNREMVLPDGDAPMLGVQKRLYALLSRNARPAKDYYCIPPAQIIEIGLPVHL